MVCLLINWFRGSLNLVAVHANSPMDATLEGPAYWHKTLVVSRSLFDTFTLTLRQIAV
jgi:hypothetical protein